MKKMKNTLLLLLCVSILSGCWDSNEPERLVYANGLGIDYKDGKVIVYLQIINVKGLAKSEYRVETPVHLAKQMLGALPETQLTKPYLICIIRPIAVFIGGISLL